MSPGRDKVLLSNPILLYKYFTSSMSSSFFVTRKNFLQTTCIMPLASVCLRGLLDTSWFVCMFVCLYVCMFVCLYGPYFWVCAMFLCVCLCMIVCALYLLECLFVYLCLCLYVCACLYVSSICVYVPLFLFLFLRGCVLVACLFESLYVIIVCLSLCVSCFL
jgi:hypothetical protein